MLNQQETLKVLAKHGIHRKRLIADGHVHYIVPKRLDLPDIACQPFGAQFIVPTSTEAIHTLRALTLEGITHSPYCINVVFPPSSVPIIPVKVTLTAHACYDGLCPFEEIEPYIYMIHTITGATLRRIWRVRTGVPALMLRWFHQQIDEAELVKAYEYFENRPIQGIKYLFDRWNIVD